MQVVSTVMPFVTAVITFVFAGMVVRRYTIRKGFHLLIWGVGLTLYAVAESMAAIHGAAGWTRSSFGCGMSLERSSWPLGWAKELSTCSRGALGRTLY